MAARPNPGIVSQFLASKGKERYVLHWKVKLAFLAAVAFALIGGSLGFDSLSLDGFGFYW
jgi:hypothetical protein